MPSRDLDIGVPPPSVNDPCRAIAAVVGMVFDEGPIDLPDDILDDQ